MGRKCFEILKKFFSQNNFPKKHFFSKKRKLFVCKNEVLGVLPYKYKEKMIWKYYIFVTILSN